MRLLLTGCSFDDLGEAFSDVDWEEADHAVGVEGFQNLGRVGWLVEDDRVRFFFFDAPAVGGFMIGAGASVVASVEFLDRLVGAVGVDQVSFAREDSVLVASGRVG